MKRRDFLKLLGVTPIAVAIPILVKADANIITLSYREKIIARTIKHQEVVTSWTPIKQSEINTESPITTTLAEALK